MGVPLGTPPSYYTSIYDLSNGQAFLRASGKYYGSLMADEVGKDTEPVKNHDVDDEDVFLVQPSLLEMYIFGLLNKYLDRGSFVEQSEDGLEEDDPALTACKSTKDCSLVSYCNSESSSSMTPTYAGGSCVCSA